MAEQISIQNMKKKSNLNILSSEKTNLEDFLKILDYKICLDNILECQSSIFNSLKKLSCNINTFPTNIYFYQSHLKLNFSNVKCSICNRNANYLLNNTFLCWFHTQDKSYYSENKKIDL